jgi:hypothetical protein
LLKLVSVEAIGQLRDETDLSVVKLWLVGLLGGLEIVENGGFYDAAGVAIGLR